MRFRSLWPPIAIALFAFTYLYICGMRRFDLGMSFAYTGGYEILTGRLPYRDFNMPVGPMIFLIQAFFFRVFGVSYRGGFLAHAALLNTLAALLIYDTVRRKTSEKSLAVAAGIMTAVWFYPISHAHPWYDQESFFFVIAALWLITCASASRKKDALLLLAGLTGALAFFTKQSNGFLGIVCLGLYVLQTRERRQAAAFSLGGLIGLLSLSLLFSSWGGWESFFFQFLVRPIQARGSHWAMPFGLLSVAALVAAFVWRWKPLSLPPAAALMTGITAAFAVFSDPANLTFLLPLAALPITRSSADKVLLAAIALMQVASKSASNNEWKIFWPFIGLQFSLIAQESLLRKDWRLARPVGATAFVFLMAVGLRLSYSHSEQPLFPMTTFFFALFTAVLGGMLLAHRKRLAGAAFCAAAGAFFTLGAKKYFDRSAQAAVLNEDGRNVAVATVREPQLQGVRMIRQWALSINALMPHLRALPKSRKPVFFYHSCDILYAVIGQNLPQPELWFDPSFTFIKNDGTETRVMNALEKNGVGTVVLCAPFEPPSIESKALLEPVPLLKRFLMEQGKIELELPLFQVYDVRRSSASGGSRRF